MHERLSNVINAFEEQRHELIRSRDTALTAYWIHLDCVAQLNSAIAHLAHFWTTKDVNSLLILLNDLLHLAGHSQDELSKEEQSMLLFLSAIGHALFHHDTVSMQQSFSRAVELVPIQRYRDAAAIGTEITRALAYHPYTDINVLIDVWCS
jgi:hypothetical protein